MGEIRSGVWLVLFKKNSFNLFKFLFKAYFLENMIFDQ